MSQETDPEVLEYLQQLKEDKTQEPSSLRKSVTWNALNTALGKRIFGWAKEADGYDYQATRFGKRYESKEAAPVAGTRVAAHELGDVRWANPSSEPSIRERLRKER